MARQYWPPRSRESGTSQDKYDLDHVAERLGLPGKVDSVARLARKHGGYDRIPLEDPEYRSYLEGDLRASRALAESLPHIDAYTIREHAVASLAGRMTLNGFRVDTALLGQRLAELAERKAQALDILHEFGLPLTKTLMRGRGKARHELEETLDAPLAADTGRDWLEAVWAAYGIANAPLTGKTGKIAMGSDALSEVAARPDCPPELRSILKLIDIVVGTRTVYQTARDTLCPDGRCHPSISFRQASGRWSFTKPGLTVYGKHEGRHIERDIFIADEGCVLLSFDLKQVDMRAMAGLSGDPAYAALFEPGRDAHTEIGNQVGLPRQAAKMVGHGWNYGLGPARMIREGMDPDMVRAFVAGMTASFPRLIDWREEIREHGKAGLILDNGFGRRMQCDPARAYTVAPALEGQGGARDIMAESLLRMPDWLRPFLRGMIHDEILLNCPEEAVEDVIHDTMEAMTWTWHAPGGIDIPILCDMSGPGRSWGEISAEK